MKTSTSNSSPKAESQKMAYNPAEVEAKWIKYWFDEECFNLDIEPEKPKFSIALPPPNITGSLHMGHALNGTIQDLLIRLKRMQGYNVLWQPGTDHAGISTQMVVERKLKKENKDRHQLGREKFMEEVWQWREQYGNEIYNQFKRLGVSFNWDRRAFTMDPDYQEAIYRAFMILYKEGYIYRGHRVTNWCPRCLTSLSDLEVKHEDVEGFLYLIDYPLAEGGGALTVATTRPESMLGDVAVAVHPQDDRYGSFVGRRVKLPLTDRTLPVIADAYVEREFGTGALKITPAHDANDWEVGQRHQLSAPVVIDAEGRMLANDLVPKQFQAMDRFEARQAVVESLQAAGLLREVRPYLQGLGKCERCSTVIEPYLSEQWWVRMKELAEPAIQAVEEERIVFVPQRYAATYLDWMRNIRDWNISRQLWWGHRIPVWVCQSCKHEDAFETPPTVCDKCGSSQLVQDPDVLDTWFSSALWPFATLGWPRETPELKAFYPTSVLSTAREIINLWVSRMIFTSLKFLKTIPFKYVLIHPVIQTADGKIMSKSKGTGIDPLKMIDKYGTDALRFYFTSMGIKGDQDVRFREDRLDEFKKFANKLWNAGRFVLYQLGEFTPAPIEKERLTLADAWILHRYNLLLKSIFTAFNDYDFQDVARLLYDFVWDDFCDWYVEIAKIQIANESPSTGQTRRVLYMVFEGLMRALHPVMPFITEELWSQLPKSEFMQCDTLIFAPYPRDDDRFIDTVADRNMELLIKVIRAVRNIRQTFDVPQSSDVQLNLKITDDEEKNVISNGLAYMERLARAKPISINTQAAESTKTARVAISSVVIAVPLETVIDVDKSRQKLLQRKQAIEKDLSRSEQQLANPEFLTRAPREKVADIESQTNVLRQQIESVNDQLKVLES